MSTDALLTILLLAGIAAAAGLVGVWAAVSEGHWFWRSAAVWGCVAVLVPVRVWEPAMVFAIALPLVVVMIWGARGVRSWRDAAGGARNAAEGVPYRWVRFGLLDVLLAVTIAGLVLVLLRAILKAEEATTTYEVFAPAVLMAGLTATVYWLVVGPWRPAAGLIVVLMTPLGAWLLWPKVEWLFAFDTFAFFRLLPVFTNLDPRGQYLYGLAVGFAMLLALELMIGAGLVVLLGFQSRKAGIFTRAAVSLSSSIAGLGVLSRQSRLNSLRS